MVAYYAREIDNKITINNVNAIKAILMMINKSNARSVLVQNVLHITIVPNVLTICSLQIVLAISN